MSPAGSGGSGTEAATTAVLAATAEGMEEDDVAEAKAEQEAEEEEEEEVVELPSELPQRVWRDVPRCVSLRELCLLGPSNAYIRRPILTHPNNHSPHRTTLYHTTQQHTAGRMVSHT